MDTITLHNIMVSHHFYWISEEGGSEEAVRARVSATWAKWRDLSGVISDIRPVLLYGAECLTVRKKEEQILEKTEMRMLRRIRETK